MHRRLSDLIQIILISLVSSRRAARRPLPDIQGPSIALDISICSTAVSMLSSLLTFRARSIVRRRCMTWWSLKSVAKDPERYGGGREMRG